MNYLLVCQTQNVLSSWDKAVVFNSFIVAFGGLLALFIAIIQIRLLIKSNALNAAMGLETDLFHKKARMDDLIHQMRLESDVPRKKIYKDSISAANQSYLNTVDRLCFCINKKHLKEKDWKSEYCTLVNDCVSENEDKFGITSSFKNIKELYTKWKD